MKQKILFLTNLHNSEIREDLFLSEYLQKHFDVKVCHPLESEKLASKADLILIRNIWPTRLYREELDKIFFNLRVNGFKIYNPLAKGDRNGKRYLIELYKNKYLVIPTIDKKEDLGLLGSHEFYFIKPVHGSDKFGCKKVTKQELLCLNMEDYVIQPFVDMEAELSFYFIDNKLTYALYTSIKGDRWNLKPFTPTKKELAFAKQFIKWNDMPYGLQRVDVCKTKEGKLLLIEIEDYCPYLSLLDLDERLRKKFFKDFIKSLNKAINDK